MAFKTFTYSFFCSLLLAFQVVVPAEATRKTISFETMVQQCEQLHQERQEFTRIGNRCVFSVVAVVGSSSFWLGLGKVPYMSDFVMVFAGLGFCYYVKACDSKYEQLHYYRHKIKADFLSSDSSLFQDWINCHNVQLAQSGSRYAGTIIAKTIEDAMNARKQQLGQKP